MLSLRAPTDDALRRHVAELVDVPPTYGEVGATLNATLPAGYRHDRYERVLGDREAFDLGREGLRTWAAHRGVGASVTPSTPPVEGTVVVVHLRLGPLHGVAPCRIVYVVDEPDRYGFAYGTLPGHPERGEEAFLVERGETATRFRIVVFSRPAHPLVRLGGPVARQVQRRVAQGYLSSL